MNFDSSVLVNDQPPTDQKPTVYVHNYFGKGGTKTAERHAAGKDGDRSPYGFHLASKFGYHVLLSQDYQAKGKDVFRRVLNKVLGFDTIHAWRNRKAIAAADVIWTMTEGEAFAIACLFRLKLLERKPIITSSVWIIDNWERTPSYRKATYAGLSKYLTAITVQSEKCLPIAKRIFPNVPVELMYFGINTELFQIKAPEDAIADPIRIFAAGTDHTRDWDTLVAAFGDDDRFDLAIYCSWFPKHLIPLYNNLQVFSALTIPEFLGEIGRATIVAVPMKENIFSGITFALDATALGKPVLCSRTGGVPTYFEEGDIFYAPVGDAEAMRAVVASATPRERTERARTAQRRFIERDYSTTAMMGKYAELTARFTNIGARQPAG
jgi:glycosyltransferase involved in cell wall biosynthesis